MVPQGLDIIQQEEGRDDIRRKYGLDINWKIFLMVAGIRPVKNIIYAMDVFSEVYKKAPDIKLVLIGPAIDRDEVQKVFDSGKNRSCFQYLGERRPEEVRKIMYASDVFLNTSLHEGMPGTVMEAMAEGLPVLASKTTGNSALVKHLQSGLLVPIQERELFIDAAVELSCDEKLRQDMGTCGRKLVKRHYSIKQEIDKYIEIYRVL